MKSVHFVNAAQRARPPAWVDPDVDHTGGWRPRTRLGAPAPGGLALPSAQPTASWLYAPRGVHLGRFQGRDVLVAADTGNHRVLIWHTVPTQDEQPCDVVVGQPDATSEGPAAGGTSTRTGMFLPTGVLVHEDMLVVADAWHHRILIYTQVPTSGGAEPDLILGQADPDHVEPNRGGDATATSLYWPFGISMVAGRFYIADTGNRRVLGWSGGLPSSADTEPDLILGQPDATHREENRGGPAAGDSFRWPHSVCGSADRLLVADAGNHRVLGWRPPPSIDRPADLVLGQTDFGQSTELPFGPQRADLMRFPYALDNDGSHLAVADTANNRILWWEHFSPDNLNTAPDSVLGQPSFAANGENHWSSVTDDSLCWPYGISLVKERLAVADSGNNRIVLWERER